jgi:SAV_6107-like HEPN
MHECAASTLDMLERSRGSLLEACQTHDIAERYLQAQLGALRAGAALVAARSGPAHRRRGQPESRGATGRPGDLWSLVAVVAPELGEWADFFAHSTARRERVAQGSAVVSTREADDLLRQAETFAELVASMLGLPRHTGHGDLLIPTVRT